MSEVVNTPGYYYAIAYILAAFIVTCTNRKKITGWRRYLVHIIFFAALAGFMELTDGIRQALFLPSMAVSISMMLVYIYTCCDFKLPEAGYYCARAFIGGEFAASMCWLLYYYTRNRLNPENAEFLRWSEFIGIYAIIFTVLYLIERGLQQGAESIRINGRELLTVIIITVAVFAVSNVSYLDQYALFGSPFAGEMFTIRTLVDLSGIAVLYAYHIQMRELQMKFEVDTMQNILEMQYKNYQLSQESIEIVNQKYHDLKHQITLLKAEANSKKSIEYLEEMERDIRSYEAQNKTGNKVLDAVLTSKSLYCQNHDIGLTCVADGTLLDFMAEMDISALFGNVLDNAIESVEKLDDKEKRLIHLSVAKQKNFLRIRSENYTEEKITFKNGMPVTTKKDKRFHGFGMKSIQSTVRKYGGSVTAGVRDNWFELRILIPLKD
ncbi:ATP-binding protein [Lachnoclostridium sp. An169]|uniref:ATP-binding protein n=1 Tax=Lachnoclostridium sp. An169 TaxID=1965569 RepID=UPI000B3A681D|nr:sensor histidine kinase [Lachnoclostridium sp. An169]OUP85109.1 ATP-binding protein [Lachnoclostridium sp. An169]HJA67222.1 GHKL domain-containing protein [Candidatus Mediterraneibacter cottocaccae]